MIYIDENKHCHTTNPEGTFRGFDVPFFRGKCQTFVEGFVYVPKNDTYVREDGAVFEGEKIMPWKDSSELEAAQRKYERELLADAENALAILLGGDVT